MLNDPCEIVIFLHVSNRKFLFVNDTFYNLLGYTRRQIRSMEIFDIILPLAKNNYAKTEQHLEIAILGFTDLLSGSVLDERQKDFVHLIDISARNLLGIINDILDFSKIEAGKLDFESIDFNFDEVIENLSEISGFRAFGKGLEFIVSRSSKIPRFLKGDPVRLNQILTNVISNAVKSTQKGEIDFSINILNESAYDILLHFSIRDTGIGMSEHQIKKLFNVFSQADSSTTRKFGGTGLGMSITRNLIQLMNGKIDVESESDKGTVFHIELKFSKAENSHLTGEILPHLNGNLNV